KPTSIRAVLQAARFLSPRSPHSRDPCQPAGYEPFGRCGTASFALRDGEPHGWVGNSTCMDKVTTLWERGQFCEERAATAIDPEAREQWQKVADACYFAAEAAERAAGYRRSTLFCRAQTS